MEIADYIVKVKRENGTILYADVNGCDRLDAIRNFKVCYRHGKGEIIGVYRKEE